MKIARRILLALALAAGLGAAPANATVITAGSYDFNLDFTAATPYSWANVQVVLASLLTGQHLSVTFFTRLKRRRLSDWPGHNFRARLAGPSTVTIGAMDRRARPTGYSQCGLL